MAKQKLSVRQHLELLMVRVFSFLPIDVVSNTGAWLGCRSARRAIRLKRKWIVRLHRNFERLEGLTDHKLREQRILQYAEHLGRVYAEYSVLDKIGQSRLIIRGEQNLMDIDGPVIYASAHTGHWELMGEVVSRQNNSSAALYDPIPDKARLQVALNVRKNFCPESDGHCYVPASNKAAREMVRYLQQGKNLLIFIDEEKAGYVWSPALGRDLPFLGNRVMAAKLAVKHRVPIVPIHIQRMEGANFEAVIEPPIIPDESLGRRVAAVDVANRLNSVLEQWVKEDISHWYWLDQLNLDKSFPK
nr:lysophospholipid acyltransferase family protein [uncultured Amphritea sp.]